MVGPRATRGEAGGASRAGNALRVARGKSEVESAFLRGANVSMRHCFWLPPDIAAESGFALAGVAVTQWGTWAGRPGVPVTPVQGRGSRPVQV